MIELAAHRSKTSFDVSQALAKRELTEGQTQKLIATRKPARPFVAPIASDTRVELVSWKKLHQLRKHQLVDVHQSPLVGWKPNPTAKCGH
jgi:hypothetical protein